MPITMVVVKLIDRINRDNSIVNNLDDSTLKSIEKLMLKNEGYFKKRYDDAQHIYNIVLDKLEGEEFSYEKLKMSLK